MPSSPGERGRLDVLLIFAAASFVYNLAIGCISFGYRFMRFSIEVIKRCSKMLDHEPYSDTNDRCCDERYDHLDEADHIEEDSNYGTEGPYNGISGEDDAHNVSECVAPLIHGAVDIIQDEHECSDLHNGIEPEPMDCHSVDDLEKEHTTEGVAHRFKERNDRNGFFFRSELLGHDFAEIPHSAELHKGSQEQRNEAEECPPETYLGDRNPPEDIIMDGEETFQFEEGDDERERTGGDEHDF